MENIKNYSLEYINPGPATQATPAVDPWADAVNYYKPPILKILQDDGSKRVQELFEKTQIVLNVPQLQLDQFVGVIDRMIINKQLTVVQQGASQGEAIVALPVPA